jgi:4-amino-4-deoxy-L-arabinose transferase-like glycosyltransferase
LDWLVLAGILALSFGLRWPFREVSLIRDEGEYVYAGQQILKGAVPYVDVYNQKTPFVFYLMALVQKTAGHDLASLRIATTLYGLVTALVLYVLARRLFGRGAGLVAALAFSVMTFDQCGIYHSASTEFFLLLWMAVALFFWYRGHEAPQPWLMLLAGAAAGLAYQTKQSGLLLLIFFALESIGSAIRSRSLASLPSLLGRYVLVLSGFAVILGLTLGYFAWKGALGEYIACTWTRNWQYVGRRHQDWFHVLTLARFALFDAYKKNDLAFWIWGSAGLVGLAFSRAQLLLSPAAWERSKGEAPSGRDLWILLMTCIGFALLAGTAFMHYWEPLIVPLALGNAVAFQWLWRWARWPDLGLLRRAAPATLLLAPWVPPALDYARYLRMNDAQMTRLKDLFLPAGARQAAQYLADHTSPDECILIAGSEPQIYYAAGRTACTRFVFTYPLTGSYTYAAELRREFLNDLASRRPRYVVFVREGWSWTEEPEQTSSLLAPVVDVLQREYRPELSLGPGPRAPPTLVIYRRKDS